METLRHLIKNRLEIAARLKKETPIIEQVLFEDVKNVKYSELKEIAEERNSIIDIRDGIADIIINDDNAKFFVYSVPLIVSEPVIVEG